MYVIIWVHLNDATDGDTAADNAQSSHLIHFLAEGCDLPDTHYMHGEAGKSRVQTSVKTNYSSRVCPPNWECVHVTRSESGLDVSPVHSGITQMRSSDSVQVSFLPLGSIPTSCPLHHAHIFLPQSLINFIIYHYLHSSGPTLHDYFLPCIAGVCITCVRM